MSLMKQNFGTAVQHDVRQYSKFHHVDSYSTGSSSPIPSIPYASEVRPPKQAAIAAITNHSYRSPRSATVGTQQHPIRSIPIQQSSTPTSKRQQNQPRSAGDVRVPLYDVVRGKKLSGFASPMFKNLEKYLATHPNCIRYNRDTVAALNQQRRERGENVESDSDVASNSDSEHEEIDMDHGSYENDSHFQSSLYMPSSRCQQHNPNPRMYHGNNSSIPRSQPMHVPTNPTARTTEPTSHHTPQSPCTCPVNHSAPLASPTNNMAFDFESMRLGTTPTSHSLHAHSYQNKSRIHQQKRMNAVTAHIPSNSSLTSRSLPSYTPIPSSFDLDAQPAVNARVIHAVKAEPAHVQSATVIMSVPSMSRSATQPSTVPPQRLTVKTDVPIPHYSMSMLSPSNISTVSTASSSNSTASPVHANVVRKVHRRSIPYRAHPYHSVHSLPAERPLFEDVDEHSPNSSINSSVCNGLPPQRTMSHPNVTRLSNEHIISPQRGFSTSYNEPNQYYPSATLSEGGTPSVYSHQGPSFHDGDSYDDTASQSTTSSDGIHLSRRLIPAKINVAQQPECTCGVDHSLDNQSAHNNHQHVNHGHNGHQHNIHPYQTGQHGLQFEQISEYESSKKFTSYKNEVDMHHVPYVVTKQFDHNSDYENNKKFSTYKNEPMVDVHNLPYVVTKNNDYNMSHADYNSQNMLPGSPNSYHSPITAIAPIEAAVTLPAPSLTTTTTTTITTTTSTPSHFDPMYHSAFIQQRPHSPAAVTFAISPPQFVNNPLSMLPDSYAFDFNSMDM